jgi:hypothetical protein
MIVFQSPHDMGKDEDTEVIFHIHFLQIIECRLTSFLFLFREDWRGAWCDEVDVIIRGGGKERLSDQNRHLDRLHCQTQS